VEPKEESTQPPIKVEVAPSARSTCRITNEKIPKGALQHATVAPMHSHAAFQVLTNETQ
jgi:hypothetical protein